MLGPAIALPAPYFDALVASGRMRAVDVPMLLPLARLEGRIAFEALCSASPTCGSRDLPIPCAGAAAWCSVAWSHFSPRKQSEGKRG